MDGDLRTKARKAVLDGKLPARRPDRLWGGPGEDMRCTLCGLPIGRDELGYELEFAQNGHAAASHHLHLQCHTAWEHASREVASPLDGADDGAAAGRRPGGKRSGRR